MQCRLFESVERDREFFDRHTDRNCKSFGRVGNYTHIRRTGSDTRPRRFRDQSGHRAAVGDYVRYRRIAKKFKRRSERSGTALGFTIPEVIIAGTIMIVICVGTLTVFSYVVKINRGNNLRMQALSVLQAKVE